MNLLPPRSTRTDTLFPKTTLFRPREGSASLGFGPDEEVSLDHDDMADRLRTFFQIDTPIEVLRSSRWFQEAMVANHYGTRRILLVGDAVHKHPPASGLGLNSGIQDVHNLCWKLALVLSRSEDGWLGKGRCRT